MKSGDVGGHEIEEIFSLSRTWENAAVEHVRVDYGVELKYRFQNSRAAEL